MHTQAHTHTHTHKHVQQNAHTPEYSDTLLLSHAQAGLLTGKSIIRQTALYKVRDVILVMQKHPLSSHPYPYIYKTTILRIPRQ
jgi:hypothetical protein